MHFFRRLSEKSRALRQETVKAGLGAFDSTSADKLEHPRHRRSEKPQSDRNVAEAVDTEKPCASKESRRRPQDKRAESKRSVASGKTAERAEQKKKCALYRNLRKKALVRQLAGLSKCARLPKTHNIYLGPKAKIKIISLGSPEQIGMNITVFGCNDTIIVVDCDTAFPSEDILGIDCTIPDISYLGKDRSKVKGFVTMYSHKGHIGALSYILKELNMPVYSTKLTIALIRHKLGKHRSLDSTKLFTVKHGDIVPFGDFNVEFIKTNHPISNSSTLVTFSPAGITFHMGDFKIDYTPIFDEAADLQRMTELGKYGVLVMLCDLTNAIRPGLTIPEKTVGRTFDLIFAEHQKSYVIVATFTSNVGRAQQVINSAYKCGKKVVVEGRSMVNVIGIANELGYIKIPEGTLTKIDQLESYPPEETAFITMGSQGESMAALSRMASGTHRKAAISPNDVVIMSSHPILDDEKAVNKVANEFSIKDTDVIFQDTCVSGHAYAEEIKLMYSLSRPKFALPVHSEYHYRKAQVEIAEVVGAPRENVLFMSTGGVVTLTVDNCKITGHAQTGDTPMDGLGVSDVESVVLCDRQDLAQDGIMIVTIDLQRGPNRLLVGSEIVSWGFVHVKDSESLMAEAREQAVTAVTDNLGVGVSDWSKLKNVVRDELSDFFWKKMKRIPVILPIILGVN